jgi:glutamate/tyrosine decarboxylase-like PLP-dependent enzyme
MHQQLLKDRLDFRHILNNTLSVASAYLENQGSFPPGLLIDDIPMADLPENGAGANEVLNHFKEHYAGKIAATSGPRYFGFVTGGSTPAAVAGDWLVSAYDQNACGSNDSIAPQLERQTIHFLRQLFGIDSEYFGSFVSGATMSNFTGLAQARQWIGLQHGIDFCSDGLGSVPVKVVSATPHSTIMKSLSMLGIGRNAMIRVPTLPDREAVDIDALENAVKGFSHSVIVVANAGTVNTVDFDDLEAIGNLKRKYNFWMHVDAAFGGFAALSDQFSHLMKGINHADSITIDAHKWLNVPYDSAMQFTRHRKIQLQVFQNTGAYLSDPQTSADFFHYTPETSRRWRALPSWFTIMAYGRAGHREIVERNCRLAKKFGDAIQTSAEFRLLSPVRMNVVCFTLSGGPVTSQAVQTFLNAIRDEGTVFFTPTVYKGIPAIRAAISNWQTTEDDIDAALGSLMSIRSKQSAVVL